MDEQDKEIIFSFLFTVVPATAIWLIVAGSLIFSYMWVSSNETVAHEKAHEQLCKYLGGNATITYNTGSFGFKHGGETACTASSRDKAILDGINEITSYPIDSVLTYLLIISELIMLAVYLLFIYWEGYILLDRLAWKWENRKTKTPLADIEMVAW